jgi:hypothetical protein
MKRVASLGIVVLLCGVGLQGGVTLPVQQEGLSHLLYEPKSPLARNHKLLQLVTEADHALQLSSAAWGSMLIHDEWSELIGWLAMARGRKPKDFKQRCVALRNFIQHSPEVDPVVSAAVLKALACIMRTHTGMSIGAQVGIGVGVAVTALTAATAVAFLATFAKLRGRVPSQMGAGLRVGAPADGGDAVPQLGAASSRTPSDTINDEEITRRSGEEDLTGAPAGVALESGATGLDHIPGTGGGLSDEEALAIAIAESLAGSSHYPSLPGTAGRETHDNRDLRKALEASVAEVNADALSKLRAYADVLELLSNAYDSGNSSVIADLDPRLLNAESAYNMISREGEGYLNAYMGKEIGRLGMAHSKYTRAKQSYEERLRLATVSMPRGDLSPIEAGLPPAPPSPKCPEYETPPLPEEMKAPCDEAYGLYLSLDDNHPVKARAWALYQAYCAYSQVYKNMPQPLAEDASDLARLNFERRMRECAAKLARAQAVITVAQEALGGAQSGSGAPSGAGAGTVS